MGLAGEVDDLTLSPRGSLSASVRGAHPERKSVNFINDLAGVAWRRLDLARPDSFEGCHQPRQNCGRGDRDVVLPKYRLDLRRERGQAADRSIVGVQVCLGTVEPDGCGIVGVSGEEQAVGTIEQGDGVRCVPGGGKDLEGAAAQIDTITTVDIGRDFPRASGVGFRIKPFGQSSTYLIGSDFLLRVLAGALEHSGG